MQTRTVAGVGVAVVALALAVATWRSTPAPAAAPATGPHPPAAVPAPPPTASDTPEQFRPLLGEWVRPDGGYVLVVRVARAQARREADLVGLFVEFDDVNYRGSTYSLGYNARSGQLEGIYYQAPLQQRFDVVFVPRR
jgi:hypothetical protein